MATFDDAKRDAADLAKLVNEDTDVTTRYGTNPKISAPKAIRLIEASGADTVNKIQTDAANAIATLNTSRGFRVVGDFASGLTYELPNDVAIDVSGSYWAYADINALPVTVPAGTTPSEPTYTQVTFNQASGVTTTAGINAQEFIDNFELKIFQSPTDNLTKVSTFAGGVGVVYEVRKTSDNSLATIYSDKDGVTSIPQNGIANVSNGDAEVVFYIVDGDYTVTINAIKANLIVGDGRCAVSDINSGLYALGRKLTVVDRHNALFEVVSGGAANGVDILDAGGGSTAVYRPENSIKPRHLGAVDGEVSTDAISKAIELSESTGLPVSAWWDDEYLIDQDIVKTGLTKVTIEGNATFKGSRAGIYLSGSLTELTTVSAQSTVRNNTITLASVAGISEGDTLIVWNSVESSYSVHRTNYYDGEFIKVKSISGNVITTESALQSSYAAVATNKVYKLGGAEININGCNFTGGSLYSLQVKYGENCKLNPTSVVNETPNAVGAAASAALNLNKCYKVDIEKGRYFRHGGAGGESGTDYGIGIANCQNVSVNVVDAYGRRHPVSTGGDANDGAVPCRFIKITKSKLANDPQADIYAADFHGNTQDSYYEDCEIYGSIGLAGKDVYCKGGKVHAWGNQRAPLVYHELVGGDLSFVNVNTTTDPDNTAIAVLNNAGSSLTENIRDPYRIFLTGGTYQLTSSAQTIVNAFENSGKSNSWYIEDFGVIGDLSNYSKIVDVTVLGSGVAPSRLSVLNPRYDLGSVSYTESNVSLSNTVLRLPQETFTDGEWEVTRLEDGAVTLSTNFSVDSTPISTGFLGAFRTGLLTATYPKSLLSAPTSVDIIPDNGSAVSASVSTAGPTEVSFFLTAGSSQTAATRSAKITVKGRYY